MILARLSAGLVRKYEIEGFWGRDKRAIVDWINEGKVRPEPIPFEATRTGA